MSLDNIQLNPKVIEELYKNSLISLDIIQSKNHNTADAGIFCLGGNNKNVVIVVNEPGQKYLSDDSLQFLTSILAACKLTIADVAIINLATNTGLTSESIEATFSPNTLLFFGCGPEAAQFPLSIPNYKTQVHGNKTFLCGDALQIIAANTDTKKILWANLKNIFLQ